MFAVYKHLLWEKKNEKNRTSLANNGFPSLPWNWRSPVQRDSLLPETGRLVSAWLWRCSTTPASFWQKCRKHSAPPTSSECSSCLECNIYLVNVLQAQLPPLTPLICVLSYAAKHSSHATLGALCHGCAALNVDISVKTFQHQRGLHSVLHGPCNAVVSAFQDKQIQPWGVDVGRNIQ